MSKKFKYTPPSDKQERAPKQKTRRWQVFGVIAAAAALTILYVNNAVKINELLRDKDRLSRLEDSVQNSVHGLQMQVIRLQSAERIDSIARYSFKMTRNPSAPQTIIVPAN